MAAMLMTAALTFSLMVRVYNGYGVPGSDLAAARMTATRILSDARIDVAWTQCPCPAPVGRGEVVVRIVGASPSIEPASLGFSYVDVERKMGTLSTVFADRVGTLAGASHVDAGELLGLAIAHEVTHLLLGTREHTTHGLMQGRWTAGDLSTAARAWRLSRAERAGIRRAIARRILESTEPALLTADADPDTDVSAQ